MDTPAEESLREDSALKLADRYVLPLAGQEVVYLTLSKLGVKLTLFKHTLKAEIHFTDEATITIPGGEKHLVVDIAARVLLTHLLDMKPVKAEILKSGLLRVEFETGYIVEDYPDQLYESWRLNFANVAGTERPRGSFICTAGGEVVIFDHPFGPQEK